MVRDLLSSPDGSASGCLPRGSTDSLRSLHVKRPLQEEANPVGGFGAAHCDTAPTSYLTAFLSPCGVS